MTRLSTAISALQTSQRGLDITGSNVANANTPGYHRQIATLSNRPGFPQGGFSFGLGVEVLEINRARSQVLERVITQQAFRQSSVETRLREFRQAETMLSLENVNPADRLDGMFDEMEALTTRLDDRTTRAATINGASELTTELNTLAVDFRRRREFIDTEIRTVVNEINSLTEQIGNLNLEVQKLTNRGINANDFADRRDQLVNQLAGLINVETIENADGQSTVTSNGAALVLSRNAMELTTSFEQTVSITADSAQPPLNVTGGRLGGLLEVRNSDFLGFEDRLNTFANELIRRFDPIHAQGLGTAGAFDVLTGHRAVDDVNVTLDNTDLQFSPTAGSLFIGVTNETTGARTVSEVIIDPAAQQLASNFPAGPPDPATSVVDAISAVANLAAFANSETGQLMIQAAPGFSFDFVGGVNATPDTAGLTGTTTATPTFGGVYTGTDNDTFTVTFTSANPPGTVETVGVTAGLQIQVTDSSSNVLGTFDIGEGYSPGDEIEIGDGITVALTTGDVTIGESFSTAMITPSGTASGSTLIANSDTSGLLTALGLNTFFEGDNADTIAVNRDLTSDPDRLATSRTGNPSDSTNLTRMADLRDQLVLGENAGDETMGFRGYYNAIVAEVAIEVQELNVEFDTQQVLGERLEAERQSISGVDPNEELVQMIKFQRMFQFAAQFITVSNRAFDELMTLIR